LLPGKAASVKAAACDGKSPGGLLEYKSIPRRQVLRALCSELSSMYTMAATRGGASRHDSSMTEVGRHELLYSVDRLIARGRRVFGWGWAAHSAQAIEAITLSVKGSGWDAQLPVNYGLARDDVKEAFPDLVNGGSSGFVVTGYLPHVPALDFSIELKLGDGSTTSVNVTRAMEAHSARHRRLRELRWLAQAVLRRIRHGDFRGIVHRAKSQNYSAPSLDSLKIVANLLPLLKTGRAVSLVFDHNMGGGANLYRRTVIEERVASGRIVLLCTYNLPTLDYRLHLFAPGAKEQIFRISSFLVLESLFDEVCVDDLFLNSPVSFDEPLVFAEWLATMRTLRPKTRLTVATHDYFSVCPSFVLLNAEGRYCGIPKISECAVCIKHHRASYMALSPRTEIGAWRAVWGRCLSAADEVRCFSESTRRLLLRAYPSLEIGRISLVPHRVDYMPARLPKPDHSAPLIIGIIGHISVQKGALVVKDVVREIERKRQDIRVVVIGTLDAAPDSARLVVTGSYQHDDLVRLIEAHRINMFFFPSICPETFSYVIEEMMRLELPIVAFDLGAPAERLRNYSASRLCEDVSAQAALAALVEYHEQLGATQTMLG
jgi:glycosyltransferase involved in cell wall biosynthesis